MNEIQSLIHSIKLNYVSTEDDGRRDDVEPDTEDDLPLEERTLLEIYSILEDLSSNLFESIQSRHRRPVRASEAQNITPTSTTPASSNVPSLVTSISRPTNSHHPTGVSNQLLQRLITPSSTENGRPRQRKRDRIRARLRRLAFSQSRFNDDVEDVPRSHRHSLLSRLRLLIPQQDSRKVIGVSPTKGSISHLAPCSGDYSCIICLDNQRDTIFVPCGHFGSCFQCSENNEHCAVCRQGTFDKIQLTRASIDSENTDINCECGQLRNGMFYPCGHVCFCYQCCEGLYECPICEKNVLQSIKEFWA
jgi:Zinc finger, C3HC4 type (RING finger)